MFDTDGIYFVIENYATCIICNNCTQFVGNLEVQSCRVETSVGVGTTEYVGIIHIILTGIYDTDSTLNIIGIPYLGDFFGQNDSIPNPDDDGTK